MSPEAGVRAGSPTPEEETAIRAAIERIWLDERAKARTGSGPSPWIMAARVEAARYGITALRGKHAWRLAGILGAEQGRVPQTGRGDAK